MSNETREPKQTPNDKKTKQPAPPSYERIAEAAQLLLKRNGELEKEVGRLLMEVGRLHMIVNAYKDQFEKISNSGAVEPDVTNKPSK